MRFRAISGIYIWVLSWFTLSFVFTAMPMTLIPMPAHAGAWPNAIGDGQIITTTLFDNADVGYDDAGKANQDVDFNKSESLVYWEYGLTDKTTLVAQSSFQTIQFRAGVDDVDFSGIGESYVGLRRVLWQDDKWVISGQAGVLFAGAGETVSDADLGFGSTHYEVRALLGRSFKLAKRDGFFDIQAARRIRPESFPSEWRLDATAGWRPIKQVQILGQGFYTASEEEFEVARPNTRLKLQGSLVYDHSPKTSYQIGTFQTIAGRNIVKEKAFFIGIWKRY